MDDPIGVVSQRAIGDQLMPYRSRKSVVEEIIPVFVRTRCSNPN
jgi:hypothetical protein